MAGSEAFLIEANFSAIDKNQRPRLSQRLRHNLSLKALDQLLCDYIHQIGEMSTALATTVEAPEAKPQGMRKNGTLWRRYLSTRTVRSRSNKKAGKQWHEPKSAFRPKAGNSSYAKRLEERKAMSAVKAKEKEMKEEKEAERQVRALPYYQDVCSGLRIV